MKISDKKLKKAHALYEAGKYEDALKACEKVLKKEYHNEDALTIEGNSLYKLGRLEEAVINWKTNAEFNNNSEAKEFLSNIDKDVKHKALNFDTIVGTKCDVAEIRAEIQRELAASAKNQDGDLLKELEEKAKSRKQTKKEPVANKKVTKPVINTIREDNSDNNVKKEDEISSYSSKALSDMKEAEITRDLPPDTPKRNYKLPVIAACSIAVIAIGAYTFSPNKSDEQSASAKTKQEVVVPTHNQKLIDDLNLASSNKNFEDLSAILSSTPKDKIAPEDMDAYNKAYDIMATEGVDKLYHIGLDKFNAKDYQGALTEFNASFPYSKDNYLRPHLLYFLGTTSEKLNDQAKEVEYFKMLLEEFPHSDMYTPEVLYKLSGYYNSTGDSDSAKNYAREIENKYPSSIYYNDVIKDILYK